MAVECVIYVSNARVTGPSNISRTPEIWEPGTFSDYDIKRERVDHNSGSFSLQKYSKYM